MFHLKNDGYIVGKQKFFEIFAKTSNKNRERKQQKNSWRIIGCSWPLRANEWIIEND